MFARTCWKDLCPAGTMLALASRTTAKQCVLCSTAFLNGIHLGFVLPDPWVVVRTHHRSISRIRGIGSPLMETAPICAVPSWVTAIYSWQIQRFKDRSFPGRGPVWSLSQAALQRRGTNVIQRTSIESVKSTARSGRLFSRPLQQCPSPAVQMVALASKIRRSLPIDNERVAFLLVIVLSLVRRMLHCTQSVRQIQSFSSIQDARNCSSHPHFTDPSDTETLRAEFHFHCQSFPFRHFLSLVSCLTKGTKMLLALQLTSWQGDVSEEIWAVSTGVMSAFCQDMWLFRQSLIGCVLWNANLAAQVALPVVIAFKLLAPAQMASPPELERLLSLVPRVNHCYHQAGKKTPFRVVMVVGDQSTGKSALLQRFVGFPVNITKKGTATRRPLRITLHHSPKDEIPKCKLDGHEMSPNQVFHAVWKTNSELEERNEFDFHPLDLEIWWNRVISITLIDLPGLKWTQEKSDAEGPGSDHRQKIKEIILKNLQSHRFQLLVTLDSDELTKNKVVDFLDEVFSCDAHTRSSSWSNKAVFAMCKIDKILKDPNFRSTSSLESFLENYHKNSMEPFLVYNAPNPDLEFNLQSSVQSSHKESSRSKGSWRMRSQKSKKHLRISGLNLTQMRQSAVSWQWIRRFEEWSSPSLVARWKNIKTRRPLWPRKFKKRAQTFNSCSQILISLSGCKAQRQSQGRTTIHMRCCLGASNTNASMHLFWMFFPGR